MNDIIKFLGTQESRYAYLALVAVAVLAMPILKKKEKPTWFAWLLLAATAAAAYLGLAHNTVLRIIDRWPRELYRVLGSEDAVIFYMLAAACLILSRWVLGRKKKRTWPITVLLGLIACSVYFGTMHKTIVGFVKTGPWPTFHYFLGAKYFEEVEYFRLYRMMLLADHDSGTNRLVTIPSIRHSEDYTIMPRQQAIDLADQERPIYFTDARWEAFKADWVNMAPRNSPSRWRQGLNDRGFNPPPFWAALPGFVAQPVVVDPPKKPGAFMWVRNYDLGIKFAAYLLVILLAGLDAGFIVFIFAELAPYNTTHQIGTYFQFMFFSSLVASMAFLRRKLMIASGLFLAAAAMLRIFPLVFVVGPGIVWLRKLITDKKLPKKETAFLLAFSVGCAAFIGIGLAQGEGPKSTVTFVENIVMHADNQKFDRNKFGLKRMLAVNLSDPWADTGPYQRRIDAFEKNKTLHKFLLIWMIGLLAVIALLKIDDDAWVLPMGYLLYFGFMVSSQYYYLALVVFLIPPKKERLSGFVTIAAASILAVNTLWWILPEIRGANGRPMLDNRAVFTAFNFGYFGIINVLGVFLILKKLFVRERPEPLPGEIVDSETGSTNFSTAGVPPDHDPFRSEVPEDREPTDYDPYAPDPNASRQSFGGYDPTRPDPEADTQKRAPYDPNSPDPDAEGASTGPYDPTQPDPVAKTHGAGYDPTQPDPEAKK
jgi:hypothetical protein